MDLVETLKAIQGEMKASDAAFAERLGLSPANWTMIRLGSRGMGRKVLARVRRAFPELSEAILDYATYDGDEPGKVA